jgi:hypothetical protein
LLTAAIITTARIEINRNELFLPERNGAYIRMRLTMEVFGKKLKSIFITPCARGIRAPILIASKKAENNEKIDAIIR